jgi:TPR repeat protein
LISRLLALLLICAALVGPPPATAHAAETPQAEAARLYQKGQALDKGAAPAADRHAVDCYLRAARLGHPKAQVALANHYLAGTGVRRDPAQALRWYARAAERGEGEAFHKLGAIYRRTGQTEKAYACWLLAAELGEGETPAHARALARGLEQTLSTAQRARAMELATAWRVTIDR